MTQVKVALFMIDDFEETEAVCTVDILRRAGVEVTTVSLGSGRRLLGRSGICVEADAMFDDIVGNEYDMLVIPGGTVAYTEHSGLVDLVRRQNDQGLKLAAICAAPAVLGTAGVLRDRRAVIYPGMEKWLDGALPGSGIVETDGNITTSKGPGTAVYFALSLVEQLMGKASADKVSEGFLAQKLIT